MLKNNFKRNFIWNFVGSTLSSFISLFFMIIATRINGINDAGIFSFAFSTACVFYVIGIYSGRTFQITDKDRRFTDSDYFYAKLLTCFFMFIIAICFCCIRGYDFEKFAIIILCTFYKLLEAFSESTYAVIQKQDRLYQVGKSLFIKALLSLLGFLIVDLCTGNLLLASAVTVLANLLVILFYDFPCLKLIGFKLQRYDVLKVWQLLLRGFFTFGFTFLNLYIIQSAKYAIDITERNDIQTYYGIIAMPATVLSLFGNYLIQPFLTSLKRNAKTNFSKFISLTVKLSAGVLGFGCLCLLISWLMGIPALELLYGVSLPNCLVPLLFIILGGTFNAIVLVFSTALITIRHFVGQFIIYVATAIFAFISSAYLVAELGLFGASLSYLLAMLVLLVLYLSLFIFRVHVACMTRHLLRLTILCYNLPK